MWWTWTHSNEGKSVTKFNLMRSTLQLMNEYLREVDKMMKVIASSKVVDNKEYIDALLRRRPEKIFNIVLPLRN